MFTDRPEHSVWSHSADGYRYMATAVRGSIRRLKPDPAAQAKKDRPPGTYPCSLDDLFEDRKRYTGRRERIG